MSCIAIVGKSGQGKSTSYLPILSIGNIGLNPAETLLINVSGKDLPVRKWQEMYSGKISEKGNYLETSNADTIKQAIEYINTSRLDITNIVVDDAQYIMSFEFMRRAKETGYGKFADIGVNIGKVLEAARNTRKNLNIFFLWHPELDQTNSLKMKSVGNMVR